MRRNYPPSQLAEKPFISSYHINEVPLPYYNPLQDPHLKAYFSSHKVNHHIQQFGLIYKPRREYPYQQRRAKNGHKFLKINLCETPTSHIFNPKNMENNSCVVGRNHDLLSQSKDSELAPVIKRKSASEMLEKVGKRSYFGDVIQKMPYVHSTRRSNLSSDTANKSSIFKRKHFSNKKPENAEEVLEMHS